jgi:hypothetical protein
MRNQDLIELVKDPNFISGIHNYCDRWCERCPFTSRCVVYAMGSDEPADPAADDISNAAFWQKLASIFQQTRELVTAWAEQHDVDLSASSLESIEAENEDRLEDARIHPLSSAAEDYAFAVSKWFDEDFTALESISDNIEGNEELANEAEDLNEAFEVIRWYQFFIAAKTVRGVLSRDDEKEDGWELPKDSDGSIKVALIAIDRSVSAWRMVQLTRPELSDSVLPLLLRLERLRRNTEAEFPEARDFIRAGFDEPTLEIIN